MTDNYGVVYFIGAALSGPVKIGYTSDATVNSRLMQLQIGAHEDLVVLGKVEGSQAVEQAIHGALDAHLVRGEWFERAAALAMLDRLKSTDSVHGGDFQRRLMFATDPIAERAGDDPPLEYQVAQDLILDVAHSLSYVNTEKPLPFKSWLKQQTDRDGPTGDIAIDAADDEHFPEVGNLETYLAYLAGRNHAPSATLALIEAWMECDLALAGLRFTE